MNLCYISFITGFKKRHSDKLSIRTPEACSIARAMAFNKPNVDKYFDKLQEVLSRHESFRDGSRVYNLDETSTSTVQNSRKLVSPKGCKQVHQVKTAERGVSVTTSVIIGAHGTVLPPVMIFPRKVFKSNMIINAYPGTLGLANDKGYNTKETFVDIMNHFIKCTNSSKDNPTLLLLDNVDTHFSTVVLDLAKDNGVTIFTFPPHCTHKLQPLDVGFFGPFKAYYDKAIHAFILSNPGVSITIYHLAGFVRDAMCKAAMPSTIINSFQTTGICPYNRDIFQECDFIMATVTHQPNPTDPPPVEEDNIPPQDDNTHTQNDSTVPDNFVTPEALKGFPHAKPTNATRKPRRKGKCMVATDTPEKIEISQREKEVKEKKEKAEERKRKRTEAKENKDKGNKKKGNKKKKKTVPRTIVFETSDEENQDSELDDPLEEEVENVPAQSSAKILLPSEGDYVLVNFKIGKDGKHYVGKIIQEKDEDDDLQISYMRRVLDSNPPQFVMPNIPDLNSVCVRDIIAILPKPSYPKKATRRQQSVISFDFNFGTVNLC